MGLIMRTLAKQAQHGNPESFIRLIFQLYYGEQYTTREIAAILHMNESTVKSRLHRGKEHLKAQLQGI